jgi:Zn-dependent peptidase ImmA (M78 family)
MNKTKIAEFVDSQKSLHLYQNIKDALADVLSNLSDEQFENVRNNLIVMAFHNGMNGQVMHFDARDNKFAVMQLYVPKNMPQAVLKWVIAHELGHVMQNRNWEDSDGMNLEDDATLFAKKIGYPKTHIITKWLSADSSLS